MSASYARQKYFRYDPFLGRDELLTLLYCGPAPQAGRARKRQKGYVP
jgi:hypothetical protein